MPLALDVGDASIRREREPDDSGRVFTIEIPILRDGIERARIPIRIHIKDGTTLAELQAAGLDVAFDIYR